MKERESDADDTLLIEAARGGDEDAFGRLVERYQEGVYAALLAITHDFDVAREIAQEVFLRAWFGLARLEEVASFGAWLRTIARNRGRTWQPAAAATGTYGYGPDRAWR